MLIVARALQGAAGALLVPSTLAMIVATFPPDERGAAIGSWTAWARDRDRVGPLAGGLIVDARRGAGSSPIDVAVRALTLVLCARGSPALARAPARGTSTVSARRSCALGLAGPVFALIEQPRYGWGDPLVAVPLVGGIALLVAFVLQERRAPRPDAAAVAVRRAQLRGRQRRDADDVRRARRRRRSSSSCSCSRSPATRALEAGLAPLPLDARSCSCSPSASGALADRIGPRLFMGVGPLIAGVGMLLFMRAGRRRRLRRPRCCRRCSCSRSACR